MSSVERVDPTAALAGHRAAGLRLVLDAAIVQLHDGATGVAFAEPAVVAVDGRSDLPYQAGWGALGRTRVTWPFENLDRAGLDPDPEPRRCLLAHLLRTALDARPWWDRILRPVVTLVLPPGLSAATVHVLCSDARFAGASRHVRLDLQVGDGPSARPRRRAAG